VSDSGNREGEIVARFATEVEIPQKRPQGRNQLLCGRGSTLAGPSQEKVAYGVRSPLTDIIAEGLEQLRSAASVKPKRRRLRPAMRLKPIEKGSDQSWSGVLVPN
jgi:hypothetical protein